jgi:hypothetical protein
MIENGKKHRPLLPNAFGREGKEDEAIVDERAKEKCGR